MVGRPALRRRPSVCVNEAPGSSSVTGASDEAVSIAGVWGPCLAAYMDVADGPSVADSYSPQRDM